jgi:hypothetical protein
MSDTGGLILCAVIFFIKWAYNNYKKEMQLVALDQMRQKNKEIPKNKQKSDENYLNVFYDTLHIFGFEISSFEQNMLNSGFIALDRNPFDMVLCYIMPVIASSSFRKLVENGENYLPVHIASFSKVLFENGNISENQFKLLNHIVELNVILKASKDTMVDEQMTLGELSQVNHSELKGMPDKCHINLKNNNAYSKGRDIFEQEYQKYVAS